MSTSQTLSKSMEENIEVLKAAVYEAEDLKMRDLTFQNTPCKLIYIDSLVDKKRIERNIIEPLLDCQSETVPEAVIKNAEYSRTSDLEATVKSLLEGSCALVAEGDPTFLLMPVGASNERAIQEPENEHTITGAHDG